MPNCKHDWTVVDLTTEYEDIYGNMQQTTHWCCTLCGRLDQERDYYGV